MKLEHGKIDAAEFHILVIVFTIGSSILVVPSIVTEMAGKDAWIAFFLCIVCSLGFIRLYNSLASLYPDMTFVQFNEKILGKWLGKITSLLFLYYNFFLAATFLREIGDFIITIVMVETPICIILLMFILTSAMGIFLGLEVISRTAVIFFPWIIVLVLFMLIFLLPEIEKEYLLPIVGEGFKPIMKGFYYSLAHPFLELMIFLMIKPSVIEKKKMKKFFYLGTIIGGSILFIIVLFCILVLGPETTSRQTYPAYTLGKKVSIGNIIERIEILVAIIWFFTIYFKLTICFYGVALGTGQLLGLNNYRILLLPFAFLFVAFALLLYPDTIYFYDVLINLLVPFSLTVCFLLPLLLWIVGKLRSKQTAVYAAGK